MSYEIEKNVPVDLSIVRDNSRFPLLELEVGDSFLVAIEEKRALSSACVRVHRKYPTRKYIIRKINANSVRCWRMQ